MGRARVVLGTRRPVGMAPVGLVLVGLVLVGLVLSACGAVRGGAGSGGTDVRRAAFAAEPEVFMMALATGVLGGNPDTGCLWLEGGAGKRTPLLLQDDTAELDVTTTPPQVRDGSRVLAAFGDEVEVGGGFGREISSACPELGEAFTGHGLRRKLPGAPPQASFRGLRPVCDAAGEPVLEGVMVVDGVPRLPLLLDAAGPAGQELARLELPAAEGVRELVVPLHGPPDGPFELIVSVSEGPQTLVQEVLHTKPGPACG